MVFLIWTLYYHSLGWYNDCSYWGLCPRGGTWTEMPSQLCSDTPTGEIEKFRLLGFWWVQWTPSGIAWSGEKPCCCNCEMELGNAISVCLRFNLRPDWVSLVVEQYGIPWILSKFELMWKCGNVLKMRKINSEEWYILSISQHNRIDDPC